MQVRRSEADINLVIAGAGGHGSEVLSYAAQLALNGQRVRIIGVVDDNKSPGEWHGQRILGGVSELAALAAADTGTLYQYITAIGNCTVRQALVRRIEALALPNVTACSVIHPSCQIGSDVRVGVGSCLAPGVIVTTSASIGNHCIVNVKVSISHDSVIEDFVNLNPGVTIAGNVRIGQGAYIGAGATIIENVSVGDWTVVGAGAVVIEDIPSHVTAVGVPARIVKRHAAA